MESNQNIPMGPGTHTLPPLPYSYQALEPIIDAKTLQIHHGKHHKKYVDELNRAELALAEARNQGNDAMISYWENQLAFNGSGHILHSIYWRVMAPQGTGGSPGVHTLEHINWYFGSMDAFRMQFSAAAKKVEGSGWAILGYHPAFSRLEVLQCEKHQNLTQWGILPILVCDVWEHAYYLNYQNERDRYVDAFWQLINWDEVEKRFLQAAQGILKLHP